MIDKKSNHDQLKGDDKGDFDQSKLDLETNYEYYFSKGLQFAGNNLHGKAIEQFKQAIEKNPDYPEAYYNWGLSLVILGKYEEAIEKYKKAIEKNPEYVDAYNDLGGSLISIGKQEEAIEQLKKAIEKNPEYAHAYNNWGASLNYLGKHEDAIEQFKQALAKKPDYAVPNYNWGISLNSLGKHEEAIEQYIQALEKDPGYAAAYYNLGLSLSFLGKQGEVIKQFKHTVEKNPDYAEVYNTWGRTLNLLEKYEEAIEQFKQAVVKNPDYAEAYFNWGWSLFNLERYKEATEQFKQAVVKNPDYAEAHNIWGVSLSRLKRYEEAIEQFKQAVVKNPDYFVAYKNWGDTLYYLERYEEAIEKFKYVTEKIPYDFIAYNNWGKSLNMLEKYEEAIEIFRVSLEQNPHDAAAYYNLGWSFNKLEKHEEAVEQFKKAIDLKKNYKEAYYGLGYSLAGLKNYDASIEQYQMAIEIDSNYVYSYHNIAHIYQHRGEYETARKWWKKTLDLYENSNAQEVERIRKDADFFLHLGGIHHSIFNNYDKAEKYYKKGMGLDSDHTGILSRLIELHIDREQEITDEFAESVIEKNRLRQLYWILRSKLNSKLHKEEKEFGNIKPTNHSITLEIYKKVNRHLDEQIEKARRGSILFELGVLHLNMKEFKKAENSLLESIGLLKNQEIIIKTHHMLGIVYLHLEDFKAAIEQFKIACNYGSDDLSLKSNLAQAYLKGNMLDNAEFEYKNVLRITRYHVDSLIGLGEVFTAIGDSAKEGIYKTDSGEMYLQAQNYFTKAIELGALNSRWKEKASKILTRQKLSSVFYMRGYTTVALYESEKNKDSNFLNQAKKDFKKIPLTDPQYHKAVRAIKQIDERTNIFLPQNLLGKVVPWILFLLALTVFIMAQFSFYAGPHITITKPIYVIDEQTIEQLDSENVSSEVVDNLKSLTDQEFVIRYEFLEALRETIDVEEVVKYEKTILNYATEQQQVNLFQPINISVYILLTFGALLFMVAGPYLQQISRFKFAGIEIEKTSIDQVTTSYGLEIGQFSELHSSAPFSGPIPPSIDRVIE